MLSFLNILKKYNILKVKSTVQQIKSCVVYTIKASVRQVLAVWCMFDHPDVAVRLIYERNYLGTENFTNEREILANIVTVKTAVLEEWNECFLHKKLH